MILIDSTDIVATLIFVLVDVGEHNLISNSGNTKTNDNPLYHYYVDQLNV